jgi:2-polyprenyl-6-methoxyphenol hydroxylase-like FAD-dependent oxidoreductase
MSSAYDLIIVGGGIGGSALAAVMAGQGKRVLLLEASEAYEDRVRGEWIAPWGVVETKRVGLYDTLVAAGGWHVPRHVTYDESREPDESETKILEMDKMLPDIPGPLCIGHPHHCQTLFDAAGRAGAETLREVRVLKVEPGPAPKVTFEHAGKTRDATCRLIVGADGRASQVREACGIALNQDRPHHFFAGLLVEGAEGWDPQLQAVGVEGDFNFLIFPQGNGRARVYGSYALEERKRFAGPEGARIFLDSFRMACSPKNEHIAKARPIGPLMSYFNNSSAAETPVVEGVVLVGDAAGWNDPIIGQGLSITYRDVRLVTDILSASDDWSPAAFAPYAEERIERMRRLRFSAALVAEMDAEFDEGARERRARYIRSPRELHLHGYAMMVGPENVPAAAFTEEHRQKVLSL